MRDNAFTRETPFVNKHLVVSFMVEHYQRRNGPKLWVLREGVTPFLLAIAQMGGGQTDFDIF